MYIDTTPQVQQMMKVKVEREDVRQENAKLQSDLRKLQRTLDAKLAEPAANTEADKKLQEQLQVVKQEKAGLQEQVQQLQQQASSAPVPQQPTAEKEGGAQGYPQTWKLVDQLRTQNRSAVLTYINFFFVVLYDVKCWISVFCQHESLIGVVMNRCWLVWHAAKRVFD
jgi:HSP90 family molecular chaperone